MTYKENNNLNKSMLDCVELKSKGTYQRYGERNITIVKTIFIKL